MDKNMLKQTIAEQRETFVKAYKIVERLFPKEAIKSPKIVAITGVRRCGKSTLLRQISKTYEIFAYINFEDDRLLDFTYHDFTLLLDAFLELYPHTKTMFFDEIQVIAGWEKFARRLFTEGYKIFITGSNAKLLSSEIASSLTGRNLKIELYPFSFKEYLSFKGFKTKDIYLASDRTVLSAHLRDYQKYGGFPEMIVSQNIDELKNIYQDIIIKDLIFRFKIRDSKEFRELALFLITHTGNKISFNNLKNLLSFSNTSKVKNYIDFMTEAYLFFLVSKYDYSIKKQIVNDRKIYAIDSGIVNSVSFQFSQNKGRILENIVFLELKRRKNELYYYSSGRECDFLIKQGTKIAAAIQVAVDMSDQETRKREIDGLKAAMEEFGLKEGLIVTQDHEETLKVNSLLIKITPLWKFLLE